MPALNVQYVNVAYRGLSIKTMYGKDDDVVKLRGIMGVVKHHRRLGSVHGRVYPLKLTSVLAAD